LLFYVNTLLRIRLFLLQWRTSELWWLSTGWAKKSDTSRTISKHADVDS